MGPNPLFRSRPEVTQAEGGFRAAHPPSSRVRTPSPTLKPRKNKRTKDQRDAPAIPMRRRQRELLAARDESPCARVSERRSRPQSTSPADIDGLYEYVVPEEITYGGDVPANRSGSPWAGNPRSFAQTTASTENAPDSSTPEQGARDFSRRGRQRVPFESLSQTLSMI